MKEKKTVDWESIEKLFRAGVLSNVQIAKEHDITEGALRKRAKRDGWTKDLKAKIKARAEELVRVAAVRAISTSLTPASEQETVEINAQAVALVDKAQKSTVDRLQKLALTLLGELEDASDVNGRRLLEQLIEVMSEPEEGAEDDHGAKRASRMKELMQKALGISGRIDSAQKLSTVIERVVHLQREIFGMNDSSGSGSTEIDTALKALMEMKKNGIRPEH
jgi:hypothetical protein